jgi:hypothetical protein
MMTTACQAPEPAYTAKPPVTVTVSGSRAWVDWIGRASAYLRTDRSKLLDVAVMEYLASRGFLEPAPRRR